MFASPDEMERSAFDKFVARVKARQQAAENAKNPMRRTSNQISSCCFPMQRWWAWDMAVEGFRLSCSLWVRDSMGHGLIEVDDIDQATIRAHLMAEAATSEGTDHAFPIRGRSQER